MTSQPSEVFITHGSRYSPGKIHLAKTIPDSIFGGNVKTAACMNRAVYGEHKRYKPGRPLPPLTCLKCKKAHHG